jgi:hypothetical protein
MPLGKARLASSQTVIYTVPAGALSATIRSITAANISGSTQALTLWLVNPGQSAGGAGTTLVPGLDVPAGSVLQDDGVHVLRTGGKVVGQAGSAGAFDVVVDGAENS